MRITIDDFTSITGWSSGDGVTVATQAYPQYIAEFLATSLQFSFATGGAITKTVSMDVSAYNELTFHIASIDKSRSELPESASYQYKINFGGSKDYFILTAKGFNDFTLDISDVSTITELTITATHSDADTVIISNMIASIDQVPLDVYIGVQEGLNREFILKSLQNTKSVGTIASALLGASSVIIATPLYLERNMVVQISSGGNTEIHQVDNYQGGVVTFTSLFDGLTLLNAHTSATVKINFPVEYGTHREILLPGIMLWSMSKKEMIRTSKGALIIDTKVDDSGTITFMGRREGAFFIHEILIDCEAYQRELLMDMETVVSHWLAKQIIYINGKQFTFNHEEVSIPEITSSSEDIDIVPKIQYRLLVEIKEELWTRESIASATTTTITMKKPQTGTVDSSAIT